VLVTDPWADADEARHEYGLELVDVDAVGKVDAVVWAVAHDQFRERFTPAGLKQVCCNDGCGVVVDVKSVLNREAVEGQGMRYWSL
jgi:UDP-N-acetyl-D-galactosamine dehydrogenase